MPDRSTTGGGELLKAAGFRRDWWRRSWIGRDARKLFAFGLVKVCEPEWLREQLDAAVPAGEFWFYLEKNRGDLDYCYRVLRDLDMVWLAPVVRGEERPS